MERGLCIPIGLPARGLRVPSFLPGQAQGQPASAPECARPRCSLYGLKQRQVNGRGATGKDSRGLRPTVADDGEPQSKEGDCGVRGLVTAFSRRLVAVKLRAA